MASSFRQGSGIMTPFEAAHLAESLERFPLSSVGSEKWMAQHETLERLNIQAHHNALSRHDEFVVEAFAGGDGAPVRTLVHELLAVEAWRAAVLPRLADRLTAASAVKAYMVLYHEATVCNLLEVLLYHRRVAEAADEALVELVDYCARKMNQLNAGAFRRGPKPPAEGEAPHAADLRRQAHDVGFAVAACAVTIFRFVTEHAESCAVGVLGRVLDTHDSILSLAMLAQRPPWTRRGGDGLEKFVQQKWVAVPLEDAQRLTQLEGQVWLALYNLVLGEECRRRYRWHSHRKEKVVALRRLFTEALLDQLPPLRDLQRAVEELAVMEPPPPTESSPCVIEQMPEMRERLEKEAGDGKALAEAQLRGAFSDDPAQRRRDMARLAATYNLDQFDEVLDEPVCAAPGCGLPATKRCSRCKTDWYCGRECQVASWRSHKDLCGVIARDRAEKEAERAKADSAAKAKAADAERREREAKAALEAARPAEGLASGRIVVLDDEEKPAAGEAGPSRRVLIEEMD